MGRVLEAGPVARKSFDAEGDDIVVIHVQTYYNILSSSYACENLQSIIFTRAYIQIYAYVLFDTDYTLV